MTKIGLRELRQNASVYLRMVTAGETVQIVDRGRPVALWIPLPHAAGIASLEAESRLSESEGDLLDLGPPLAQVPDSPLPSEVLALEREHER
ncbi:MAG: type II toxin-antitoxin system prevent-host-death family antitoxin [Deltaproteobacteria bacterium]